MKGIVTKTMFAGIAAIVLGQSAMAQCANSVLYRSWQTAPTVITQPAYTVQRTITAPVVTNSCARVIEAPIVTNSCAAPAAVAAPVMQPLIFAPKRTHHLLNFQLF
jgi:hypothetical protein